MSAPTTDAARRMGELGATDAGVPHDEAERLAFEAWMAGHCWKVGGRWDGRQYIGRGEAGGLIDAEAMDTRRLWAAWRDRAALAAPAAVPVSPALGWPALLQLITEYAMHVHDASEHQAESRADISKTAALKTLERIRMALAAHDSRWQALVHELIWRAAPAAPSVPAGWISVADRMPPPDTRLLVVWGDQKAVDKAHTFSKWKHHSNPLGYLIQGHPGSHNDVTHWMPLPAAPTDGGQGHG